MEKEAEKKSAMGKETEKGTDMEKEAGKKTPGAEEEAAERAATEGIPGYQGYTEGISGYVSAAGSGEICSRRQPRDLQLNRTLPRGLAGRGCRLCPRECGADRAAGKRGRCGVNNELRAARAALHMWEEPCISGREGSGAVFFSGCPLGCAYCQNREISRGGRGIVISEGRLAEIFLELQQQGANNINLVTAGQYLPQVCEALEKARVQGLSVPVVYNSSAYEKVEALQQLEGLVDVYLPDFKYISADTAGEYSKAPDYPQTAKAAVHEMVRQKPEPRFDARGVMTSGVIVRHLLLPGHVREAKEIVRYLHETYGEKIYISMMNQYTPMPAVADDPLLSRRVTKREYARLLAFAAEIGVEQGFYQEGETAMESFIPEFSGEGVLLQR